MKDTIGVITSDKRGENKLCSVCHVDTVGKDMKKANIDNVIASDNDTSEGLKR